MENQEQLSVFRQGLNKTISKLFVKQAELSQSLDNVFGKGETEKLDKIPAKKIITFMSEINRLEQKCKPDTGKFSKMDKTAINREMVVNAWITIALAIMDDSLEYMKESATFRQTIRKLANYFKVDREIIKSDIMNSKIEYDSYIEQRFG